MTLYVTSMYGAITLAAPFDQGHAFNLATGAAFGEVGDYTAFGVITNEQVALGLMHQGGDEGARGSRLQMQGSLAQLKQWVNALQYTSAKVGVTFLFSFFE